MVEMGRIIRLLAMLAVSRLLKGGFSDRQEPRMGEILAIEMEEVERLCRILEGFRLSRTILRCRGPTKRKISPI